MEGSGSGSTSSYSSKSHSIGPPASPPRSSSSISELFDGWAPKSNGGLLGFGTESSKSGFAQQRPGVMGRESNKTEGTATQRGHFEGHSVGNSARNMTGSNSQKYQSIHGKSQSLSDAFLASSLYYGGRDLYHDPSTAKTEGVNGQLNKDNMDDDTNTSKASRGNWWQGSLYY
ncbi:uncharacterized protein LOC131064636 isoform X1 [Cryptomeria japonica]|uniref:uncharacterized protein LOC131064636 isoform X1 n=1 Tax=Cryptomeria japonica TaxID=3369 RepID=UPI0027DA1ECB|nr:uncharacterized protein LOC131064636 isoform X1 [Cryptomeria japonica]